MKIAVYPGSFDPPTNGHTEIIFRSSKIFDKVVIAVTDNTNKKSTFTVEERKLMLVQSIKKLKNVEVDIFSGLLVEYVKKKKATVIIRGLRAISDFEYEVQLALMNRRLSKKIETIFFIPDESYTFLSSSLVKEIAGLGGKIDNLVPTNVAKKIKEKFSK
ncbi:MAG: pantetheine-phosphate adenylyltransferase [Elusimicrobia bacterium]|nr:pantetheine-phosphate adenylyltransferase [Elusimicrobiota bacterium]MBU2614057.1 pantetheine-phosphate adenylyltransferase [Elusimicrobiota bacterium]